jgi:hypothetical protein
MFKTSFPSRSELQRMIEWGVMQTKDRKVVMVIEEGAGGSIFKQALRHVWVQMTSLPEELQDFPTIWVIGNILEVTKDVDMKFTRTFDRPRFQVLVLDPALILHSVEGGLERKKMKTEQLMLQVTIRKENLNQSNRYIE